MNYEDQASQLVENGGHVHLKKAVEEDAELYFRGGEDSDGDPNHPANVNSRAYNPELDATDDPQIDPAGHVIAANLEQVPWIPNSEPPRD